MSEGMTCYERDETLCEDQMCLRTGCKMRNERLAQYSSETNRDPEVVAAVQEALMRHPFWKPGLGSSGFAFGLANTAINAYTKAMEARHPAQGWQDISTAPTDGTEIIGVFHRRYDEDGPATVYGPWTVAYDGRKWRSSWDGSEVIDNMSDFGTEYKGPDIEPTHWMPLPGVSIPSTDREGA